MAQILWEEIYFQIFGMEEEYRYLVVEHHYKLIYCVKSDCIEIVAAWDCRRDPYFLGHLFL